MIIRNVSDLSRIKSDNNPCKNNIFTGVMEFRKTNVWGILFRLFIVRNRPNFYLTALTNSSNVEPDKAKPRSENSFFADTISQA